jgi:hypothetical protein
MLMVAFALGTVFVLPQPARSLDNCVPCQCKQCNAWQNLNPGNNCGLRMLDPNDPTGTTPVLHVPHPFFPGNLLAATDTLGTPTPQGVQYLLYVYTGTPILDCQVQQGENGNSIVRITFNQADWGKCAPAVPNVMVTQVLCQ